MTETQYEYAKNIQYNIFTLKYLINNGEINKEGINHMFSQDTEFRDDFVALRDKYLKKYKKLFEEA